MINETSPAIAAWSCKVEVASKVLKAILRFWSQLPEDPFESRRILRGFIDKVKVAQLDSFSPPGDLLKQLDADCTRMKAEFWNDLATVCTQRQWELHGTTSRRLLNRGLFIEATDEEVVIETIPPMRTFHVPTVLKELDAVMKEIAPAGQDPRTFMELIQRVVDGSGGGERSLEEVYRGVLWHAQKPAFWKSSSPQLFVRITRPQFRWLLAQALQLGARTSDGRELRFGTTMQPKEAWEIYSPGEGHVVQVGRLSLS